MEYIHLTLKAFYLLKKILEATLPTPSSKKGDMETWD